jgi:hypothetical protein
MRLRKALAVVLAVGARLVVSAPASAHVLPLTGPELVRSSDLIVTAVVEQASSRWDGRLIVSDYALRLEERLAGEAADELTLTLPGGTVGDETQGNCLVDPLEEGARYLLFLGKRSGLSSSALSTTGGWQGVVREGAEFRELVASVRAFVDGTHQKQDLVEVTRAAAARRLAAWEALKIRSPIAAPEPAVPPITFRVLPDSSPFAPHDRQMMAYWNVYHPDLFRVGSATTATSFGNGVFEIAGLLDDAGLQAALGRSWPPSAFSILAWRSQGGHIVEADFALNAAYPWTLDEDAATRPSFPYSFRHVVLEYLGKAAGLSFSFDTAFDNLVETESALGIVPQAYRLATLFSDDTAALRATFGGVPILDGLISAYDVKPGPVFPSFLPSLPAPAVVKRGGKLTLAKPIKIENTGTEDMVDPQVEVLLAPQRFSLEGAVLLKRLRVRGTVPSGALRRVVLGAVKVPPTVPPGVYSLAFRLRLDGDEYPGNDVAWSPYSVTLTVKTK